MSDSVDVVVVADNIDGEWNDIDEDGDNGAIGVDVLLVVDDVDVVTDDVADGEGDDVVGDDLDAVTDDVDSEGDDVVGDDLGVFFFFFFFLQRLEAASNAWFHSFIFSFLILFCNLGS